MDGFRHIDPEAHPAQCRRAYVPAARPRWLRFRLLPLLAAALTLAACASAPVIRHGSDPRFSATLPPEPIAPEDNDGAIYQPIYAQALFEDYKARRVGDVLTVTLAERTEAQKSAQSSTSKDSSADLSAPTFGGHVPTLHGVPLFDAQADASRKFDGKGDASQSNTLEGSIAVTVSKVLPNGNLVVQGERWIRINRGEEYLRLRGIVRPVDISADNTVLSTQIADAELAYGGTGPVAASNAPGWLSRFFNSPLWPF